MLETTLDPQPSLLIPIDGYRTVKRRTRRFGSHRNGEKQLSKSKRKYVALMQQKRVSDSAVMPL